ncbi:hypothetical protein AB0H63_03515 [Micromonospora echinospora]|uniref:hypothetical protein n=1 Tax=Micromonospora echinospora TaxID=1877 RepID=UPI0033E7535C
MSGPTLSFLPKGLGLVSRVALISGQVPQQAACFDAAVLVAMPQGSGGGERFNGRFRHVGR